MRGSLAVIPAIAGTLGLLTTQVLGAVLNWQWLSIVCASLNVPFLLMLIFIPESPVYLISTEQIERAHKILRVLRGTIPFDGKMPILSFRFYVKLIFENMKILKLPFLPF